MMQALKLAPALVSVLYSVTLINAERNLPRAACMIEPSSITLSTTTLALPTKSSSSALTSNDRPTASTCITLPSLTATRPVATSSPSAAVQLLKCHEPSQKKLKDTMLLKFAWRYCTVAQGSPTGWAGCIRDDDEDTDYSFTITKQEDCLSNDIVPSHPSDLDRTVDECVRIMWEAASLCWNKNGGSGGVVRAGCNDYHVQVS